MKECRECGKKYSSKRGVRKHFYDEHQAEIETPEEFLGPPDTEQRDFHGDVPDESGHDPVYIDVDETEEQETTMTQLKDYGDGDG